MKNTIYCVGLGPGAPDMITPQALEIIRECDTVAGYTSYLELFSAILEGKETIGTGMRGEVERCRMALEKAAEGAKVAVITSGDPGIYAMAGLLMELTEEEKYSSVTVEVVPGVTAASAAAALLGAPLMNDFTVISLSNLLTPDEVIIKRLKGAAEADFVTVLYNPASRKRRELIEKAVEFFSAAGGADLPVGIVRNASRENEDCEITTLDKFPLEKINMNTLVVIGNSRTVVKKGKMYTLRGYENKYY